MQLRRGMWVALCTLAGAAVGVAAALVSKSWPDDLLAFAPAAPGCMLLDLLWLLPRSRVGIGLPTFWPLLVACIVVYGGLGALLAIAFTGPGRKVAAAAIAALAGVFTFLVGGVALVARFGGGGGSDAEMLPFVGVFLLVLPCAAGFMCYRLLVGRKGSAPSPADFDNPAGSA